MFFGFLMDLRRGEVDWDVHRGEVFVFHFDTGREVCHRNEGHDLMQLLRTFGVGAVVVASSKPVQAMAAKMCGQMRAP